MRGGAPGASSKRALLQRQQRRLQRSSCGCSSDMAERRRSGVGDEGRKEERNKASKRNWEREGRRVKECVWKGGEGVPGKEKEKGMLRDSQEGEYSRGCRENFHFLDQVRVGTGISLCASSPGARGERRRLGAGNLERAKQTCRRAGAPLGGTTRGQRGGASSSVPCLPTPAAVGMPKEAEEEGGTIPAVPTETTGIVGDGGRRMMETVVALWRVRRRGLAPSWR